MKVYKLFFLLFMLSFSFALFAQTVNPDCQDGKIYFKIKELSRVNLKVNADESVDLKNAPFLKNLIRKYHITSIERPFILKNSVELLKTFKLTFNDINLVDELIKDIQSFDFIEYAEKVPLHRLCYEPNDPLYKTEKGYFNWNWWLDKVKAQQAWDISKGNASVYVGIVDNAF
ncbi:MAG: hypothetical protein KA792_03835 [Bacteroidales bacterium]|nr:hypothetical protein [Bacteroidales bacterium]